MTVAYEDRRQIAETLRRHRTQIAVDVTQEFLERHPDWVDRYGNLARIRGEEDAEFHVEFLAGAVVGDDPSAFEDYARWTARMLSARGIAPEFLAENLNQVGAAAARHVESTGADTISRMVEAAVAAISGGIESSDGSEGEHPFAAERSVYLQAVRSGDRRAALNIVLETVRSGTTVPDIYSQILQPVQYRIGQLWEENEITVAEEHMATAITQYVVSQLYTELDIPEVYRGNALVTGVAGELHQLGAHMVADVLEADGWNVRFLGTQLPHNGVLEAIRNHEPELVGISATVLSNVPSVGDLVTDIRREFGSDISVLVGGSAFRSSPDVWQEMGADGFGRDLHDAVAVANRLRPSLQS